MLAALEIPFTLEAFFKAIEQDDVRAVRLFHAAGVDLSNTKTPVDTDEAPAIYVAADAGSRKVFRYLPENGVDVNTPSGWNGQTALLRAISRRDFEMVYALLNAGALAMGHLGRIHEHDPQLLFWTTPLQYALLDPDPVLVEALLNKGASVKERYASNVTPLMRAAKDTSDDVVKVLLSKGASVKEVDNNGMTALHYVFMDTSKKAKLDVIRVLIEAGADVNHAAKGGLTPILMATMPGDEDGMRFLLAHGADPNKVYRVEREEELPFVLLGQNNTALIDAMIGGVTPLMLASAYGHKTIAEILLQNGADPHAVAKRQNGAHTAMILTLAGGHHELANRMRAYGAPVRGAIPTFLQELANRIRAYLK